MMPVSASTAPGTPMPMARGSIPRPFASVARPSIRSSKLASAPPGPLPWVAAWRCASTPPSAPTSPAAVVVPPTSTPITARVGVTEDPSQGGEAGEPDALARDQLSGGGIGQPLDLGLALLAVAAVGEILVVVAGMGHELGHALRQHPQLLEHPLARPVRLGPRFAHEVIGRSHPNLQRRLTHGGVLGPHRHVDGAGEEEHELEQRLVAPHVVVAVKVRREAPHDPPEGVDLGAHLDPCLVHLHPLGPEPRNSSTSAGSSGRVTRSVVLVTMPWR